MIKLNKIAMASLVCAISAFASVASASDAANVKAIVPYAAGGPLDSTQRILMEHVKGTLGLNSAIVDNRPGADGNIGMAALAKSPADGSVIGLASTASHAANPWLFSLANRGYDPLKDFKAITAVGRVPNALVMSAERAKELNINTLDDLVAYAKKNPGKLNFASGGKGSVGHIVGEYFKMQTGTYALHIPYAGAANSRRAVLSGEVDFSIDNYAGVAPMIKAGKFKALAVTSDAPIPEIAKVPTFNTFTKYFAKDFSVYTWWGIVAPAKTPDDIIAKYNKAFTTALMDPEVRAKFATQGVEPVPTTPANFAKFMLDEYNSYKVFIQTTGIAKADSGNDFERAK